MDEVCGIVPSNKGNDKINKIRRVQRPCCAVTTLCNNLHYLRNCVDHNHAPQASDAGVAKLTAQ
ncbi:hypothetical protein RhiirA4_543606 [Rhizophagus irregularis]|uniref:Uncharacterized protein n=1 Tax=Rhizophagus irregularis TaxID=588596 RepID=A0A2I1GJS5_9GLOM|nr:hypothetical protein RhiirA4_543606 [Rhizophagus irregularis]